MCKGYDPSTKDKVEKTADYVKHKFLEGRIYYGLDMSKYKVYFGDTGLLTASLDEEAQINLRENKNFNTLKELFLKLL